MVAKESREANDEEFRSFDDVIESRCSKSQLNDEIQKNPSKNSNDSK